MQRGVVREPAVVHPILLRDDAVVEVERRAAAVHFAHAEACGRSRRNIEAVILTVRREKNHVTRTVDRRSEIVRERNGRGTVDEFCAADIFHHGLRGLLAVAHNIGARIARSRVGAVRIGDAARDYEIARLIEGHTISGSVIAVIPRRVLIGVRIARRLDQITHGRDAFVFDQERIRIAPVGIADHGSVAAGRIGAPENYSCNVVAKPQGSPLSERP